MATITIFRFWCPDGYSYKSDEVERWLASLQPIPGRSHQQNVKQGICYLYNRLDYDVGQNQVPGGILQLLASPEHASNVILMAYNQHLK